MWRHSVSTWRHEVTKRFRRILACRWAGKLILFLFLWFFGSLSSLKLLFFHLRYVVTSWRHVMTSQNLMYLSQLVDVLENSFFFWFYVFWVTEFKNVINFLSARCHDVTKPDLPISACWCARTLILFLFLWFFGSLSSSTLLIFHLLDVLTSWRHVMTSQNLVFLSRLVDVLESWFFFCFYGFLGHWVQKCY